MLLYIGFIEVAKGKKGAITETNHVAMSLNPKLDWKWFSHHLGIDYCVQKWWWGISARMKVSYPWQLKKIKILVAILELPAKQHHQFSPFDPFLW